MEMKITWVTAEFVNMDINSNQWWWIVHKGPLTAVDNGEKNEESKSAFLKLYKDRPSLWL